MATPLTFNPVISSTPLSHHPSIDSASHQPTTVTDRLQQPLQYVYSNQLHPVLNNKRSNDIQSHRQKIVKEIFDTEHTYLSQLDIIVTLFLKPIRVGGLLPSNAINSIFSNVEAILLVNTELFTSMRQRSLGEAFAYLAPFLKLYSTYANNFQEAGQTLQEWLKRSIEFSSFVSSQEARPECCALNLSALLITPIQRVPRYKLLLNDLLKHTKPSHIDYAKLKDASTEIAAVADHINEHIRQHENFNKMLSIQNSLTGSCVPGILAPGRKFLREGRLMKVCRRKAKERMVFLFSDILIYATPSTLLDSKKDQPRSYVCRCVLPLLNSTVTVISGDSRAPGVHKLFQVSNSEKKLLFYALKEEEVVRWVQAVRNAISDLQAAFGSLMNSQKVVLHPIGNQDQHFGGHPSQTKTISEEAELEGDVNYLETERRRSLLASTGGSMTPCTPYPLTATINFTPSCTCTHQVHDPSSRQRKISVFAFGHASNRPKPLSDDDSDDEAEGQNKVNNSKLRPSKEHQQNGTHSQHELLKRESIKMASSEECVHNGEQERTSLLPTAGHNTLEAMSTGSLSTLNIPDSKYSRCCSIL